jgi:hypothetical protein
VIPPNSAPLLDSRTVKYEAGYWKFNRVLTHPTAEEFKLLAGWRRVECEEDARGYLSSWSVRNGWD